MSAPRMPLALRVWLLGTRALSYPIALVSRRLHNRMEADPHRFSERLGQHKASGPVVWFHGASLGEVAQIGPLVRSLQTSGRTVLVTTTTQAGADWVARELPGTPHQFAPLDTPAAVAGFLSAANPQVGIFVEGDFGPRLILELGKRGIPHILLNARHSRTRERFPGVFGALLPGFARVTCRSEDVARGLRALGVSDERIEVLPDLRITTAKLAVSDELVTSLRSAIGARPVWLAASTHPADEAAVVRAHVHVTEAIPDALLILAPRHPPRGDALVGLLTENDLSVSRRSHGDPVTDDTQVYLADTLGELGAFFSLAPVTFLGGSFGDEGGHNPYEPASFGSAILSGAKVKNFADAYHALTKAGAARLLESPHDLGEALLSCVQSDLAKSMGAAGRVFMQASDDGVQRTISLIEDVL